MLFWLTFGLTFLLLIVAGIFGGLAETWKERYRKADSAYDNAYRAPQEERARLREERYEANRRHEKYNSIGSWFFAFFIGFLIVLIIMALGLAVTSITKLSTELALEEEYKVLTYQIQHEYFTNEFGDTVGSKDVMDAVADYNTKLRKNQHWEKNFWIGIFVPNIYSDKPLIQLP